VLKLVQNLFNCTRHAKTLSTQLLKTFFELNLANLALKWLVLAQKSLFWQQRMAWSINLLSSQKSEVLYWENEILYWENWHKFQNSDKQKTGHLRWKWKLRNLDCVLVKQDFTIVNFYDFFLHQKLKIVTIVKFCLIGSLIAQWQVCLVMLTKFY
jgi:hypothetical protein